MCYVNILLYADDMSMQRAVRRMGDVIYYATE